MRLSPFGLLMAVLVIAIVAAAAYAFVLPGDDDNGATPAAVGEATATASAAVAPTATPLPTAMPLPTATPAPTRPPEPTAQAAAPQPTQPPPQANCTNSVAVTSSFREGYFYVSGSTLEEIGDSLFARAPVVDGELAAGVTEYGFNIRGSRCAQASSCSLGTMTIDVVGRVTLPRHMNPASIAPEAVPVWEQFVDEVKVHEYRHVTIVQEETGSIRRQLLALDPQPNCADMDHEIDKVIAWGMSSLERRQEIFHLADEAGIGNIVAR